jgi:hypothetical protein
LVAKMMAKEPARRFQTPAEVASALESFFKKQPEPAPAPTPVVAPVPEPLPAAPVEVEKAAPKTEQAPPQVEPAPVIAPRRRPWKWIAAGVSALMVGTATLAFVMTRPSPKPEPRPQPPPPPTPPSAVLEETPEWVNWSLSMTLDLPAPVPFEEEPNPLEPDEMPSELGPVVVRLSARGAEVDRAIRDGVRFLKQQQRADGSWEDANSTAKTGTTSLVTLALLSAGETRDSPPVRKALDHLRRFGPEDLRSTYAIALQTMVFTAAEPDSDLLQRIAANAQWLEAAQIRRNPNRNSWWGLWTYSDVPQGGDNSNTQYALLGLHAAAEAGQPVNPLVWTRARQYWVAAHNNDGGWGYHHDEASTSSMTCAGISSLVLANLWRRPEGSESLQSSQIRGCGDAPRDTHLQRGMDWLAKNFSVGQNFPTGQQWKLYYLYGLERAGRLTGMRLFGQHDWYRLGSEELVRTQDRLSGFWRGVSENPNVATSFALLFLSKGRTPVLVYKLSHRPKVDWNNDPDDVRNLVEIVSRARKTPLTWRLADPALAEFNDYPTPPIVFFNGHRAPEFESTAKQRLVDYVDQGGTILADACCGNPTFDAGFRALMTELFPESKLQFLLEDHPVWRAKHAINPDVHPLWGLERRGRTAVIYSPKDLSCFWNQARRDPKNPDVELAWKLGQNIVEYATGGKNPADPLMERVVKRLDPSLVAGHTPPVTPKQEATSEKPRVEPRR